MGITVLLTSANGETGVETIVLEVPVLTGMLPQEN